MTRRSNAQSRCPRCRVHKSLCFCAQIPRLHTRTRLLLIIHRNEDRKSTNTGRLAVECLENSVVIVRGEGSESVPALEFASGTQPLLLFPGSDAQPLTDFTGKSEPITLIVPDGTWRQAFKVRKRVPGLAQVPCVSLPKGEPSQYRLRSEPQELGLGTIEAIARAFGILEAPSVQRELERVFQIMVERTLWSRGAINPRDVIHGLPPGARRHDPESGIR